MCRFTYYHGPPLRLSALLTEPENSLIRQSYDSGEREEPLNGDGFGVAWYPAPPERVPGLFRSTTPAWNNQNLHGLSRAVESGCVLAHVRAATESRAIGEQNCHPFVAGRFAFMHNGEIAGYPLLRRPLLGRLGDEAFQLIQGQTDSEHLFALFVEHAGGVGAELDLGGMRRALRGMLRDALELAEEFGGGQPSYLNIAVSDGRRGIAMRYTTEDGYDGESLYYHVGRRYVCADGVCRMVSPGTEGAAVVVSSERLSFDSGWTYVPRNHMICIDEDRTVHFEAL